MPNETIADLEGDRGCQRSVAATAKDGLGRHAAHFLSKSTQTHNNIIDRSSLSVHQFQLCNLCNSFFASAKL